MRLLAGTSGFSYPFWKGPFYPPKLKSSGFLAFYAERLASVEINNTFYRMPKATMLATWAEAVPPGFLFALKAPQRITHRERLVDSQGSLDYFFKNAESLGEHLGPVLFQLPPFLKLDLERLRHFLGQLPGGHRFAFEFRHASWGAAEVTELLGEHGCALCVADTDPAPDSDSNDSDHEQEIRLAATSSFGYLRLRRVAYSDQELDEWASRIAAMPWTDVFVYFKHEDEGAAPKMALRLVERFDHLVADPNRSPECQ